MRNNIHRLSYADDAQLRSRPRRRMRNSTVFWATSCFWLSVICAGIGLHMVALDFSPRFVQPVEKEVVEQKTIKPAPLPPIRQAKNADTLFNHGENIN